MKKILSRVFSGFLTPVGRLYFATNRPPRPEPTVIDAPRPNRVVSSRVPVCLLCGQDVPDPLAHIYECAKMPAVIELPGDLWAELAAIDEEGRRNGKE